MARRVIHCAGPSIQPFQTAVYPKTGTIMVFTADGNSGARLDESVEFRGVSVKARAIFLNSRAVAIMTAGAHGGSTRLLVSFARIASASEAIENRKIDKTSYLGGAFGPAGPGACPFAGGGCCPPNITVDSAPKRL